MPDYAAWRAAQAIGALAAIVAIAALGATFVGTAVALASQMIDLALATSGAGLQIAAVIGWLPWGGLIACVPIVALYLALRVAIWASRTTKSVSDGNTE